MSELSGGNRFSIMSLCIKVDLNISFFHAKNQFLSFIFFQL
ncbi:hypothetical protein GPUN_0718 [Glaciecola punicea ACAM 611]|uniref:Uncharacterized protein n=1 Tax=Glaciecola punicea ACAM 611 TaxID=1121923 RepID=H5T980_9ALTE|nr:hypothetical protein GPUN_0718 [Glaciecola punicea ACAM 611]